MWKGPESWPRTGTLLISWTLGSLWHRLFIHPFLPYGILILLLNLCGTLALLRTLKGKRWPASLSLPTTNQEFIKSLAPLLFTVSYTLLTGFLVQYHVSWVQMLQLMMLFPLVTLGMSQLLHLEAASLKGSAVGASWALLTLGSLAFLNEPPFWNFSLLGLFLGLKTLLGTVYCYVSCKKKWVDAGILSWAQLSYYLLLTFFGTSLVGFLALELPHLKVMVTPGIGVILSLLVGMGIFYKSFESLLEFVEEESPGSVARFPLILALIVSGSNALAGENFFAPGRVIGLVIVFIGIHWQADLDWQSNLMSTPGHLKKKFSRRSAAPLTIVALILLTRQFRGGLLSMHDNYSKWSQSSIGDTPCQLMHPEVYGKSITNFTLTSRMPHVLVTGGAGFVGSNLVMMLLSNGYRVRVLDNFETGHYRNVLFHTEPVEYKIGDIQKPLDCEEALRDIEMVFHLVMPAFNSSSEETFFAKPTALSHWVFFNAVKKSKIKKIVYLSSSEVYGDTMEVVSENSPANPNSPLGIANLAIENQIRYLGQQTEISYVILRSVPIFWHSDSETVTKLASAGSDGIHVGDVARGLILAAQQSAANNQIINLGSGRAISQLDTMTTTSPVADTCRMKMVLGLETKYGILTTFAEYSEREHVEPIAYDKLKWVTDKDILAAPWFLPKRDKTGPYYSNSKDFKTALSKIRSSQKPVSLLFFGEQETHLLLNTFFSMVAFGKAAGSLLVVSRTAKQHAECLDLNLPCVDGSGITLKSDSFDKFRLQTALEVVESGLSAHVSASDVVYSRDIHESYHKTISETGSDAIFQIGRQAMVTGSFYLLANSRTESLLKKWIAKVKPLLLPEDVQDHELILHGLKTTSWQDCTDRPSCSEVEAKGVAAVYRHHSVFHCLPRPMHDYSPCSSNRILFTQPLCSETASTKYEALKEYGLWFLTDCTSKTDTCERIPTEFVTGIKRTDLFCSDRTATLTWQSGTPARWDHMRGSLWDMDTFNKLTHGEPMFALKETDQTTQIVGL